MISKSLVTFLIAISFFSQFAYAQTADISVGCAPLEVQFNPPAGQTSFFWDFKDGATSNLAAPKNTFLNPGIYDVEFKNSATGAVISTIKIEVLAKPDLQISLDFAKGCAPLRTKFTDVTNLNPAINVQNYSWVFSDGGTAFGNNASYTFGNSGNYWVSLSINTDLPSCNVTKQFNNFINVSAKPNVNFTTNPDPPSKCTAPLDVQFTNTSTSAHPLTFEWDFGKGNSSTLQNPPVQRYDTGQYEMFLAVMDTNNCADTLYRDISVGSPIAEFELSDTVCKGRSGSIQNKSSAGTYSWNFGDSIKHVGMPLNFVNPSLNFHGKGLQTIYLTVTSDGCSSSFSKDVFIEELEGEIVVDPEYLCDYPAAINYKALTKIANPRYQYNWIITDTGTIFRFNAKDTTFVYNDPNTLNYSINRRNLLSTSLSIVLPQKCSETFSSFEEVWPPNARLMPNKVDGCLPLEVTFHDSSLFDRRNPLVKWEWHFGDGTSIVNPFDSAVKHTYSQLGHYDAYLIVTNSLGCIDTSYKVTIKVGDKINLDFSVAPTVVCIGDPVQFTDLTTDVLKDSIDAWHYYSESDRTFSCFQEANPTWRYKSEPGYHDVNFTAGFNGCFSSEVKDSAVKVNGAVAKIDYLMDCAKPFEVSFRDSSLGANLTEIQFGDGNTAEITNDSSYIYALEGDYEIILGASDLNSTCAITYDTATIKIRTIKADFIADSIFCENVKYTFDASASVNADIACESATSHSGYTWVFSDTNKRPVSTSLSTKEFKFTQRGQNKISLIATNVNGCRDTLSKSVRVYGVDADFSIDDDFICSPTDVQFTDLSNADTSVMSRRWDFDDGTIVTYKDLINHTHLYDRYNPLKTVFEVNLIVTDSLFCADTINKTIRMYLPAATINPILDSTLCKGDSVDFSASDYTAQGSNQTFFWDFMDGSTSNEQNPTHFFKKAGKFPVKLKTVEISSGCPDSSIIIVDVKAFPEAGYFTSGDTIKTICPNENILFTDTSINHNVGLRYKWDFGNGRTSTFRNPGTVFINNGTYTVTQIVKMVSPFGCADTNVRDFFVRGPRGNFFTDLNGDTICRLESVKFSLKDTADLDDFSWDFGDGSSARNMDKISHQYTFVPPSGQTVAKLILTNSDGSCPVTRDTIIPIFEVIAEFQRNDGIDTAICFAPYPITNFSLNADEWYWNFGNGQTSFDENPLVVNYAQAGSYPITLGVRNKSLGCTDTIVKTVVVHPLPEATVVGDTLCEGQIANVFVSNPDPNWTYTWASSPDPAANGLTTASTSTVPLRTSTYTLTVVDNNNCTQITSATAVVFNPLGITNFDTTIIVGDKVTLPVIGDPNLYTFKWDPEEGLSCTDCLPPWVRPLEDISYSIEITDILGCFTETATYDIIVRPETFIAMPSTFTPNGDGTNDILYLEGWGIKEVLEFKIFNRWGEIVFETTDLGEGWDGHHKGVLQNNDVYVYQVRVLTWREEEKAQEGYLNLAR